MSVLISTDVGGTFTDYVIFQNGEFQAFKALTSSDPSIGIIENLKALKPGEITEFSHGTTVAVNAILERKGVNPIFFTTKGFKGLVQIGRQTRNQVYSFFCKKPKLPVQEFIELTERTAADGKILIEPQLDELHEVGNKFGNKANVAVIGFLNSYINPTNELKTEKVMSEYFPMVITSHRIRQEIREYDRFSTSIIEGYITPIINKYFSSLQKICNNINIMQSNGGKSAPENLKKINLLFSGPAGGIAAVQTLCKKLGIINAIAYDMGGTSADISGIVNGSPLYTDNLQIDGIPIKTLALDITSIGAGGGSIAWVDDSGVLKVGPQSAGSNPGPACYNLGGKEFTVSDANLILGILSKKISGVSLSLLSSKQAARSLIDQLNLDSEQLSEGVIRIVNNNMISALKNYCLSRGYDPRKFTLIAFGGAGPMHACALADELRIRKIVIPPEAGAFSAMGIMTAPVRFDYSRTILKRLEPNIQIHGEIDAVVENFYKDLQSKLGEKFSDAITQVSFDMRYSGQGHEINIPFTEDLVRSFHVQHQARLGFNILDNPIEIVNVKLVAELPTQEFPLIKHKKKMPKIINEREIFPYGKVKVYKKDFFGSKLKGPVIIEDYTTTINITPGWNGVMDIYGILHLECD